MLIEVEVPPDTDPEVVDKALAIIGERLAALGIDADSARVSTADNVITFEIKAPDVDIERVVAAVSRTGRLSFRPVLDIGAIPGVSPLFEEALLSAQAEAATTTVPAETTTSTGDAEPTTTTTSTTVPDPFADVVIPAGVNPETGLTITDDPEASAYLLEETTGLVYFVGGALVLGSDITSALAGVSGVGGWVVDPDFTNEGARKFEAATKQLAAFPIGSEQRRFAIVLDGVVVSAPIIAEGVTAEEGLDADVVQITIGLSSDDPQAEAEDLASVLRYGSLPIALDVVQVLDASGKIVEFDSPETSATPTTATPSDPTTTNDATPIPEGSVIDPTYLAMRSLPVACDGELPDLARQMSFSQPEDQGIDAADKVRARIRTSCGEIVVLLDPIAAPNTVNSFVFLSRQGYYDGTVSHRIVPGFVYQAGDPSARGSGGPGYQYDDELPPSDFVYTRGTLAMANAEPDSNGSQFFIMFQDSSLQPDFTVFGEVESGLDVLDRIEAVPVINQQPQEGVFIDSITIEVS